MTPAQSKRFNELGCISRCLIKMMNEEGHPTTKEQFCARFEGYFTDLDANYGYLEDPKARHLVDKICEEIGLKYIGRTDDYETAMECVAASSHRTFLVSGINLNPGATDIMNHSSVITKMDANGFEVWSPVQDGNACSIPLKRGDWEGKKCGAQIFEPPPKPEGEASP